MKTLLKKITLSALLLVMFIGAKAQLTSSFTIAGNNGYCKGTSVGFTNTSNAATSSYWDFGDGGISTQTSPSHTFLYSGTYIVTLTTNDGSLQKTSRKAVYIRENPNAYFNVTSAGSYGPLMPGQIIKPVNHSTGSLTYYWNNGAGFTSTQEKIAFAYPNPGNYTLSLTTTNGCGDSSTSYNTVTVLDTNNYSPMASGYASPQIICPGNEVSFYNYTNVFTSFKWIMGDGNTINDKESFDYAYNQKGTYLVALVAYYKSKSDTQFFEILVTDTLLDKSSVSASISPQSYDPITYKIRYLNCTGTPFYFNGSYQTEIVKHTWKIAGGSVLNAKDTMITFANIGDYPLTYIFENSCGVKDSISYLLEVRVPDSIPVSSPSIYLNAGPSGTICPGNKAILYTYSGNANQLKWLFHDGTSVSGETRVSKVYSVASIYPVKLIYTSCCTTDTIQKDVVVTSTAESYAGFNMLNTYNSTSPVCSGEKIICEADSTSSQVYETVTITQHKWYMGDGNTYTTPKVEHQYASAGWYSILHETVNSCGQSAFEAKTIWLTNTTVPVANFYLVQHTSCVYEPIMIDQFSTKTDSIVIKMGDGNYITQNQNTFFPHIWYTYHTPGNYTVTLYAYNKCGMDSATDMIQITPLPTTQILMSDTVIQKGTTLQIHANVSGSIYYVWKYGPMDADTSSSNPLVRSFNTLGTYKIYLFAVNANGCENLDSVLITVQNNMVLQEYAFKKLDAMAYPNPNYGNLFVNINSKISDKVHLQLLNLNGKVVLNMQEISLDQGSNKVQLDISHLPSGLYFLSLSANSGFETIKILKR